MASATTFTAAEVAAVVLLGVVTESERRTMPGTEVEATFAARPAGVIVLVVETPAITSAEVA